LTPPPPSVSLGEANQGDNNLALVGDRDLLDLGWTPSALHRAQTDADGWTRRLDRPIIATDCITYGALVFDLGCLVASRLRAGGL